MIETHEDLVGYWQAHGPTKEFGDITHSVRLVGGIVNFVHRIFINQDQNGKGNSFILKYYPPFIALHQKVPMSQQRYFVEKEGLQLGNKTFAHSTTIRIPQLIHSDDEHFVLILEDLGDIKSLFQELKHVPDEQPLSVLTFAPTIYSNADGTDISSSSVRVMGERMIEFLTVLSANCDMNAVPLLDGSLKRSLLQSHVYRGYKDRVTDFPILHQFVPMIEEQATAMDDPLYYGNKASFGDLWPNALFFFPNDSTKKMIVLDWEFCSCGRVQSDAWQMLSYLWLMMHDRSDHNYNQTKVKVLFDIFMEYTSTISVSEEDKKRDVSTFLTNFALLFQEEDFWNFSGAEKTVLVEKTVKFVNIQLQNQKQVSPDTCQMK